MKLLFAPALALLLTVSTAQSAELKVLSGNGAKAAVRELCTQFERATGNKIDLRFEVNADLQTKIEAGENFDVAVLNPPVIDALIKDGKIVAGSRADIVLRACYTKFMPRGTPPKKTIAGLTMER